MERGKFIVFEGLDGCGKSTHAGNLRNRLSSLNIKCHCTREPSDSFPGSIARSAIKDKKKKVLQNESIALLFLADRIEHITNDVIPLLNEGITVISDRYYFSNIAYQGVDMDMDTVYRLNELMIMDRLRPDVTVFLDSSPEECFGRIEKERYHRELYDDVVKLTAIRSNFFTLFERMKDTENIMMISSSDSVVNTFEKIWLKLSRIFINESGDIL